MRQFLLGVLLLSFSFATWAQNNGKISGTIVDKITQKPLLGVSVSVENLSKGVQSDSLGRFRLLQLPYRTVNVSFSSVGYKKQKIYNIVVNSGNENTYFVELEPDVSQLQEVVVTQNRKTAKVATLESPLSVQKLTTEEIKSNPGGNFDISKVIQILPGVGGGVAGGGFRNDIIIRGGGPNENVYYLDGIEIPVLNHFQTQGSSGGPQGMLNVSFIEDVKLSSSAFDARYDNALSSVFQFRQKTGNPNNVQGNVRLSATELALTMEGPLSKTKNTTFLASARRSYLQFLFQALDIPIRPNFWDFQTKISHRINEKTTLTFMGIGAIDEFSFAGVKTATPEKLYIYNANPIINQWNYTFGMSIRKLLDNGYMNLAISRNAFNNSIMKYEDNQNKTGDVTLSLASNETENKLRWDFSQQFNGWKVGYGLNAQVVEYTNKTFSLVRASFLPNAEPVVYNYTSPLPVFLRYGAFLQASKVFLDTKLGVSFGLRTDMNTFTTTGNNGLRTLSPRISLSYLLTEKLSLNASVGQYYKLAPYTVLGFANQQGQLVNKDALYQSSRHAVLGLEYLVNDGLRFTLEGFYKKYGNVPISIEKGISLANLGSDFNVLGNEPVVTNGEGKAYGIEFFAQKKLTDRFFGVFSYTFYKSLYTGIDGKYVASSWDNRHLLSLSWGYKFPRNWELGLRFRYQGGAPYTPFDPIASQANYLKLGQGIFDYAQLNTLRLRGFHSSDVRIDKKYNYKSVTLDLFLDVTNWYVAAAQQVPYFTFTRRADNSGFATTDGKAIQPNGSNAIPTKIINDDAQTTPTIGFIVEF